METIYLFIRTRTIGVLYIATGVALLFRAPSKRSVLLRFLLWEARHRPKNFSVRA